MSITSEEQLQDEKLKEILKALRDVVDPEVGMNIVDLGLIYEMGWENQLPKIVMTWTTPFCPVGPVILAQVEKKVKELGYPDVIIELTFDPPWNPSMMSEEAKMKLGVRDDITAPKL
ncbi:MAG: metal-sulfur cluster assembly factor [Candidatus Diapherotrites archaeon]|nr:metal-sulfur cluster assembly factor [Candidatus Diapherotrites archaeon]